MTSHYRSIPALAMALVLFATPAAGQIAVSTPEVECSASESIVVPVTVSSVSGLGAYAYSFRLQYDNTKISITGTDKDNTLSASYTVVANPKEDEILVGAASASALNGEGTLINLNVVCTAEGTTPLTFSEFTFNEGDPSATTSNGAVSVSEGGGEIQINIQINPDDVQFGEITVGESTTQTITIANLASSGAALTGEVALADGSSPAFNIVSGGGEFALEAGATQEVVVSFEPSEAGDFTAELEVTHNATSEAGPATIALTGTAEAAVAVPAVLIEESELDLGDVVVFREATASFTIENTGTGPLTGSIEISGADAADFSLAEGTGEFSIEAGASLDVAVTFAPETEGAKEAELRVTHNAENATSPVVISLTGSALDNVAAEQMDEVPGDFRLAQNFPNPFNPETTVTFGLPASQHVKISVYDLTGREQRVLVDGVMPAGWHTVNFDAGALPSGTYLYHMQAGSQTLTRKMTILK